MESASACSIIIISYNSGGFLPPCLHSIFRALQHRPHQVVVVDNGSPIPISAEIRTAYPQVVWVDSPENLGFGKACNLASRHAIHPLLFFVNPDTLVSIDTFDQLIDYIELRPEAGVVGCRILNGDGSLQWACRRSFPSPMAAIYKTLGLATLFPKSRTFGAYNLTYLDPDQEAEVDAVSGSFFCVRKTVYEQVGGFDEDFFLYGEDLDICYRIQEAGYRNYYFPNTSIIHFKGQSSKTRMVRSYVDFYQAMLIFASKHSRFKPVPLWMISMGVFFAAALGVFSRLMPAWWKIFVDATLLAGISWVITLLSHHSFFPVWVGTSLTILPLLVLGGDYGSKEIAYQGASKTWTLIALGAASALGWTMGFGFDIGISGVLGFATIWLWRRMWHWFQYFRGVFSGFRKRSILLGNGSEMGRWFARENLLPDRDILGCVSMHEPQLESRDHYLGGVEQLGNIRSRTGIRELLVVSDSFGRHEEVPKTVLNEHRIESRLVIGHPDTQTFALVDLYFLK